MYTLSQRRSAADLEPLCSKQQACRQQIKVTCQDKTLPISQNMTRGGKDQLLEGSVPIQVLICPSIRLSLSLSHTHTNTNTHAHARTHNTLFPPSSPPCAPAQRKHRLTRSGSACRKRWKQGEERGHWFAPALSLDPSLTLSIHTHARARAHTHIHAHTQAPA
jgi:hypothetical protein